MYEYEGFRRVTYGGIGDEYDDVGDMVFVPVCMKCGRFVKADETVSYKQAIDELPSATCRKCGRVPMPFEGCF